MKTHVHQEEFDGAWHAACGRVDDAVSYPVFEATTPARRCRLCERWWFQYGQPEWHREYAQRALAERIQQL